MLCGLCPDVVRLLVGCHAAGGRIPCDCWSDSMRLLVGLDANKQLAGNGSQEYCIPLACEVQDGIAEIMKWDGNSGARRCSHVVEMITLAHHSANAFGKALVTLDRYFLTVPALDRLRVVNMYGNKLEAIIMAKASTIAY